MFPPAHEKTNRSRVAAAIMFAFAFPPTALILLGAAMRLPDGVEEIPSVLAGLPATVAMSLVVGWIFVLPACVGWAVLHQFDRHYWPASALLGSVTGLVFGSLLATFDDAPSKVAQVVLTIAAIGALTGLGVWWIAYGRQDRLPRPLVTLPPLAL
ncbi:hypothetical protein [Caulobacter sp.]|uniref:hypothetical protein n=1 Tax=Caulobacter sp. TaxID=78 RepID=UPI003BAE3EF8